MGFSINNDSNLWPFVYTKYEPGKDPCLFFTSASFDLN